MKKRYDGRQTVILILSAFAIAYFCCTTDNSDNPDHMSSLPEHAKRYGIYVFDPASGETSLVYSSENSIHRIHENPEGTRLVFCEYFGSDVFHHSEICIINTDGSGFKRVTENTWLDSYPSWSPDGSRILYLSWPDYPQNTMDIFVMNAEGAGAVELYDSGFHDADCHWVDSRIVFTRESQIWIMDDDGSNARQVTHDERAGEDGAGLPFGDYDPRLNPAGTMICFDRMVDDQNPSGNWNFYLVYPDGTEERAITNTGWQQFMAEWSHTGNRILFTVAAMNGEGLYDLYMMNADGSDLSEITPSNWPALFLCSHGIFSHDDSKIYFVGEWWEQGT